MFENDSKCRIWIFRLLAFSINFCLINSDLSGNTVWPQASGFQKLAKLTIFNELLSTQNVNLARFARNFKWDFLSNFCTVSEPIVCLYGALDATRQLWVWPPKCVKWDTQSLSLWNEFWGSDQFFFSSADPSI